MASRSLALTPDLLNKGIAHPIETMAEAHQHVGGEQFVDNRLDVIDPYLPADGGCIGGSKPS